jgi:hypothetical protein
MKSRQGKRIAPPQAKKFRTEGQAKRQVSAHPSSGPREFRTELRAPSDSSKMPDLPLDKKSSRGRRGTNPRETFNRAYRFELMLKDIGETTLDRLLQAQMADEIIAAFGENNFHRDRLACGPLPRLILEARRDHDWPKKRREAQIRFLARSMAAFGIVSGRRSRAICREEEKRQGQ